MGQLKFNELNEQQQKQDGANWRRDMTGLVMKYFVLKPHGDDKYAEASRKAMRAYASHIQGENPSLCKELRDWADSETPALKDEG